MIDGAEAFKASGPAHIVKEGAFALTDGAGFTTMVPVALTFPQPPVNGIEYAKVPDAVGVPEMVMVFAFQVAVKPAGRLTAAPIPVAPVVVKVITGFNAVFKQMVGFDDAFETVFA